MNELFAGLTLAAQIGIALITLSLFFIQRENNVVWKLMEKYGLLFAFLVALASSVGTFIYSEIIGYVPCVLCWLQRAFMYPQVVLLGLALFKKDKRVADYSIALATIGGLIGIYNYYLQMGGSGAFICSAETSLSCAKIYVFEFGYITIPMMSVTAFLILILLGFTYRKRN